MNTRNLEGELVQIRPSWHAYNNSVDVNMWARVHPRFEQHDGCIVDLGCLGWNKDFEDKTSDNWTGYFFGKKRIIGVDPQEEPNPNCELFRGFISNFSGKAKLTETGIGGSMIQSPDGDYEVLSWQDFKHNFNIDSISILKINIEGAEWGLIESFKPEDFENIDQICISFHDFLPHFAGKSIVTESCIKKIVDNGYSMINLGVYGWRLFIKSRPDQSE